MLQHFVPQTYLKRFAIKEKNNYFVYTYDKKTGHQFKTNINQVAAQTDIYKLKKADNENAWEEFYSRYIEQDLNDFLSYMIKQYKINVIRNFANVFNDKDKVRIALHIINQLYRGIYALDYEKSIRPLLKPQLRKEGVDLAKQYGIDDKYVDRLLEDEDIWRLSYAKQAIIPENHLVLFAHLVNRNWVLFKTSNDSFITSDSPIVFYNQQNNLVGEFEAGIGSESTVVFYPISSRLLIGMYAHDDVFSFLNVFDNKLVLLDDNDSFINNINKLQLKQCNRQVYAKTEEIINRLIV